MSTETIDKLEKIKDNAFKAQLWFELTFDLTELLLITLTVIYLLVIRKKLPLIIKIQLIFLWTQSFLFSVRDIW